MLDTISSPRDLQKLSVPEMETLAAEIREVLIQTVSEKGGHLASNLGVVELTLALHYVLRCPHDKLIFDVGHQSYVHKLITGRKVAFAGLRTDTGVSGFPKRLESEYDSFDVGHSSTAISAAVGMARARDISGESRRIVALVGDGALTGGMCYEALNDLGSRPTPMVIVLNDNEMSIAPNVGAMTQHLTRLRTSKKWQGTKRVVKRGVDVIPWIGKPIARFLEWGKGLLRHMLVHGDFFEALGLTYVGPIDGHDIGTLIQVLEGASQQPFPILVHVVTQKGKGYALAENKPEKFHGIAPFFIENGHAREKEKQGMLSGGRVMVDELLNLAAKNDRIAAITAAMPTGTGLDRFASVHPKRFFDVGIAEEHGMTLAAGMAAGGLKPYFAIYATFLQRAYDQVLHDICLQKLPVTLLIDRAGFIPGDGATHQGIYDVCFLRTMPNMTIWAPADAVELRAMLKASVTFPGPLAIHYGKQMPEQVEGAPYEVGRWRSIQQGTQIALLTYGVLLSEAMDAASMLSAKGISCAVVHASSLKPLDGAMLSALDAQGLQLVTMEEQALMGGFGSAVREHCAEHGLRAPLLSLGAPDRVAEGHTVEGLRRASGLLAAQMAARIEEASARGEA